MLELTTAFYGTKRRTIVTERANEEPKWHERTRYQVLFFAAGITLFGIVLGLILDWYINPQTSTQKKDLVQALGLITAGVAGAVGIFFTWRGQRDARETQEENQKITREQLKNAEEQLRLARLSQEANQKTTQDQLEQAWNELDIARRGQITERFTQAIDQLGSESLEIRLGAIYSLERTAREDRDYHWPIMEVLTTYVRTHAGLNPNREQEVDEPPLEPDVQAILTIIGRRSIYHGDVEFGAIDLREANLRRADLKEANFQGANLRRANLRGANFQGANFQRADLVVSNLQGADLRRADLKEANLKTANLRGANLGEANLDGADLVGAKLGYARLDRADLRGADLRRADLRGADLRGADLQRTNLEGVRFDRANLSKANLSKANLEGALVKDEQLAVSLSLQGATMPDGSKHPP